MGAEDFKINSKVRAVLARHWIDLTRLSFASVNGIVRLSGTLRRMSSESGEKHFSGQNIDKIETEILAIKEVKRAYFQLDNWRKDENRRWAHIELR